VFALPPQPVIAAPSPDEATVTELPFIAQPRPRKHRAEAHR
jgi:hypothetical protein